MRSALKALGFSVALVVGLLLGMLLPVLGRLAEWLLQPGYVLPQALWGGVHDLIQLSLVVVLNVVFYFIVTLTVIVLRTRVQESVLASQPRERPLDRHL
jgi:hypothetical protein